MPFATACCGIELMATGASRVRHRPLRRRGDAVQPAAVRPDDRRRPGRDEDDAGAAAHLAADARAEVVHLAWGPAPPRAACSTPTPSSRGSTASCRWTCTCPAARRGRSSSSASVIDLQEKIKQTGTLDGREFADARPSYEGPADAACRRNCRSAPGRRSIVPRRITTTATRLRSLTPKSTQARRVN